jgi:hypothetical protein
MSSLKDMPVNASNVQRIALERDGVSLPRLWRGCKIQAYYGVVVLALTYAMISIALTATMVNVPR